MEKLYKKGLILEYFTVGYNIIEAIVSIWFGKIANSIALIGFGLDSIVESFSGIILIWRLSKHKKVSKIEEEKTEKKAVFLVGITFFILGCYVLIESIKKLITGDIPEQSLPGIIIAFASIIVMPILAWQKYIVGKQINSKALISDSKETIACSFLSFALILGLGGNFLFGLWQLDPMVGIFVSIFLFNEGKEIFEDFKKEKKE